eukprot:1151182-Pelagomonas_calceolata.AAC.7
MRKAYRSIKPMFPRSRFTRSAKGAVLSLLFSLMVMLSPSISSPLLSKAAAACHNIAYTQCVSCPTCAKTLHYSSCRACVHPPMLTNLFKLQLVEDCGGGRGGGTRHTILRSDWQGLGRVEGRKGASSCGRRRQPGRQPAQQAACMRIGLSLNPCLMIFKRGPTQSCCCAPMPSNSARSKFQLESPKRTCWS